ncbi:MAG: hypothetical protein CSA72_05710 [Rhodobacterales bacterium]|nr:MAG: hypothetical protein CSA72_05710 [Rhodobacterales bacterium]
MSFMPFIGEFALAAVICTAALALIGRMSRARARMTGSGEGTAFLFQDFDLIDATDTARNLLQAGRNGGRDLDRLLDLLSPRFPALRQRIDAMRDGERLHLSSEATGGPESLAVARHGDMLRVTLSGGVDVPVRLAERALAREAEELRALTDDSPQLMWREDETGTVTWANRTYLELTARVSPDAAAQWPPQGLFDDLPGSGEETGPTRHALLPPGEQDPIWFDIVSRASGGHTLRIASDITSQIRAADLQRDLMQTLTKTFAGLSVGLAVFDRNRQLVLFNPALTELTGVKPSLLVARPVIDTFLSLLRENHMLPEPDDFNQWRRQLTGLEQGSDSADHVESWELADGRSYRITVRPFPNGALAFLMEDISSDKALKRQLRAALNHGRETLAAVSESVTVFSAQGRLQIDNAATNRVWTPIDGAETVDEILRGWRTQCQPSAKWQELEARIRSGRLSPKFTFTVQRCDGRSVRVTAHSSASGGAILSCRFQQGIHRPRTDRLHVSLPRPDEPALRVEP